MINKHNAAMAHCKSKKQHVRRRERRAACHLAPNGCVGSTVCVCGCVCVRVFVYMCACVYVDVFMYVCMYVCMSVCV